MQALRFISIIVDFCFLGRPCFPIFKPISGIMNCSGHVTEDICDFDCQLGYQLTGSKTRTCGSNKQWTGNNTECKSKLYLKFINYNRYDGSNLSMSYMYVIDLLHFTVIYFLLELFDTLLFASNF